MANVGGTASTCSVAMLRGGVETCGRIGLQRADEAVPQRVLRHDVARTLRIVVERMAQLRDGAREYAGRDVAVAPDAVEQVVAADQLARALQQGQQHGEGLGLDRLHAARAQQGVRGLVDHDIAEAIAPCPGAALAWFRRNHPQTLMRSHKPRCSLLQASHSPHDPTGLAPESGHAPHSALPTPEDMP